VHEGSQEIQILGQNGPEADSQDRPEGLGIHLQHHPRSFHWFGPQAGDADGFQELAFLDGDVDGIHGAALCLILDALHGETEAPFREVGETAHYLEMLRTGWGEGGPHVLCCIQEDTGFATAVAGLQVLGEEQGEAVPPVVVVVDPGPAYPAVVVHAEEQQHLVVRLEPR